jgi:hypothetical protein
MTAPIDEKPGVPVEVRGGDREADWNTPLPFIKEDLSVSWQEGRLPPGDHVFTEMPLDDEDEPE